MAAGDIQGDTHGDTRDHESHPSASVQSAIELLWQGATGQPVPAKGAKHCRYDQFARGVRAISHAAAANALRRVERPPREMQ